MEKQGFSQRGGGCILLPFFATGRGTTCGNTFHGIFHGIPRNLLQTSTAYHGTLSLSLTPTLTLHLRAKPKPRCLGHWGVVGVGVICRAVAMECRAGCFGGCHSTSRGMRGAPHSVPWNPMPRHGMSRGCHGMPWVVSWLCHGKSLIF